MTLQASGISHFPTLQMQGGPLSQGLAATTYTYDSATDRVAWVGSSPVTDSLASVHFRLGNVVTGCTVDVRIETLTNGRPSGTLWATNTNASVVINDTDDNGWKTATLTAAASFTRGDKFAIVIVVSSGTPNLVLNGCMGTVSTALVFAHWPLTLQDTGAGTWASAANGFAWIADFTTNGPTALVGLTPVQAGTVTAYNSGTSPDERAMRFQLPFKTRVLGMRVAMFNIAAGADFTFSLWDTTGTTDAGALAQATQDGDFALSTTQDGFVDLFFASPPTLSAATTYYAGVRADTANNIGLGEMSNSAITNALRALPGVSAQVYLSTRVWTAGTAGAWTDTTTTFPMIHLIIDQLDDGAGGAGLAALPLRGYVQ